MDGEHYVEFAYMWFLLTISLIQLVNAYYNLLRHAVNIYKASMADKINIFGVYNFKHVLK